jgi:hypothetical protein
MADKGNGIKSLYVLTLHKASKMSLKYGKTSPFATLAILYILSQA